MGHPRCTFPKLLNRPNRRGVKDTLGRPVRRYKHPSVTAKEVHCQPDVTSSYEGGLPSVTLTRSANLTLFGHCHFLFWKHSENITRNSLNNELVIPNLSRDPEFCGRLLNLLSLAAQRVLVFTRCLFHESFLRSTLQ